MDIDTVIYRIETDHTIPYQIVNGRAQMPELNIPSPATVVEIYQTMESLWADSTQTIN